MFKSLRGSLLVAIPTLLEPNFYRTVVLVCDHDDEGAVGLVINRPTDAPVAAFLPAWSNLASAPGTVSIGGPVARDTAVGLARLDAPAEFAGWTPVRGSVGLLDLSISAEEAAPRVRDLRVFSGYAGWGPAQLDAEVAADGWFVVNGETGDPFRADPSDLWRIVLRRDPGRLRLYADFPDDPSFN